MYSIFKCECVIIPGFSLQFTALKQSRDSEEQRSVQHRGQTEELQALQEKVRRLTVTDQLMFLIRLNHHRQGMQFVTVVT